MKNKPYDIYLSTPFSRTPVHGVFVKEGNNKIPRYKTGLHGILEFDSTADDAVKYTNSTHLLGRAFGADDCVIGIDCDHWVPDRAWTNNTGYWELSQSKTGVHIICRVDKTAIPMNVNKILLTKDRRAKLNISDKYGNIELFIGRGNGIALTGYDSEYGTPYLDPNSEAGKIVYGLLRIENGHDEQAGTGSIPRFVSEAYIEDLRRAMLEKVIILYPRCL